MGNGTCKGTCRNYHAKMPNDRKRYENGQKNCSRCQIFIKWNGIWCPCCGNQLRTKSKYRKSDEIAKCEGCDTTRSIRGPVSIWFDDGKLCWMCYFAKNEVKCSNCHQKIRIIKGKKTFVIKTDKTIICTRCNQLIFIQNKAKRLRNIKNDIKTMMTNPILNKI